MRELIVAILVEPDSPDPTALVRAIRTAGAKSVRVVRDAREFVVAGCPSDVLVALHATWAMYDAMCRGLIVVTSQRSRYLWHLNNSVRVPSPGLIPAALRQLSSNEHLLSIVRSQAKRIRLRCDRREFIASFAPRAPRPEPARRTESSPSPPPAAQGPAAQEPAAQEPTAQEPAAPKVSVIMPCYNDEGVIDESVRSVLSQTWQNLELIAVDDGSADGTRAALAALAKSDDRVTVACKPNGGPSSARNLGLRLAGDSDYIAFLDSDDTWNPAFLHKMIGALTAASSSVGFAYCNSEVTLDGEFKEIAGVEYSWPRLINGWGIIPTGTFVVTRAAADSAGLFDEEIERGEDLEWMWRIGLCCEFVHVAETLHHYRRESGGQLATAPVNIELLERRRRECLALRPPTAPPVNPARRIKPDRRSIATGVRREER